MHERIVITGIGICSAVGNNVQQFIDSLRQARTGLKPYECREAPDLIARYAGTITDLPTEQFEDYLLSRWDRGTLLAACAAREAIASAKIDLRSVSPTKLALATGASGSGQFYPRQDNPMRARKLDPDAARVLLCHNVPCFQTNELARYFGMHGPVATVSSASAGSGIAIGIGMRWLQSGRANCVLAGGGEGLLPLNIIGFDSLGILCPGMCSPFSRSEGMSMGEGAGFVVLERYSSAVERGANILAELYGFAVTSDAFDAIQFDPSGDGIHRAMNDALADSQLKPDSIQWIRASGAGGRSQDAAEIAAIENTFGPHKPWVSSLESTVGHTNGAGPAMGLVACVACSQSQLLPATINFDETMPCGPYDFVPNVPRDQAIDSFVSTTAAFGGTNVVLVGGKMRKQAQTVNEHQETIAITGIGIVSPQGCGTREVAARLLESRCSWQELQPTEDSSCDVRRVAKVRDFDTRKLLSSLRLRGVDTMTQYAAAAVRLALHDSGLSLNYDPARVGVVTGVSRPSHDTLEKLLDALEGPWASLNVSKNLLRKGRFLIASQLANWYRCKGYSATITDGLATTGLTALSVAAQQLSLSDQLDAVIVVAADHASPTSLRLWESQGCLATGDDLMLPYSELGRGMILGEGAVALVLQRANICTTSGTRPLANLISWCSTFDAPTIATSIQKEPWLEVESSGKWLSAAIEDVVSRAGVNAEDIGFVLGNGCGIPEYDLRELRAVQRTLGEDTQVDSINPAIGVLEASCGLMSVATASAMIASNIGPTIGSDANAVCMTTMRNNGRAANRSSILDRPLNSLVIGSSEKGRNMAVLIAAPDSGTAQE